HQRTQNVPRGTIHTNEHKMFHVEQSTPTNTKCSTWNNPHRQTQNVPRGTIRTNEHKMFHVEQFIPMDTKCSTWNNLHRNYIIEKLHL
ncbi:MAG: hypothetical protein K2K89_02895, partial [Ruminococcus sp.]|nr:hypothetical protein [Ruminococcus sp.]